MKILSYIMMLLIVILGVTFSILNAESVNVHYYFGMRTLPLSLAMALSFGVGLIIGMMMMGLIVIRLKTDKYRIKKRLKTAEQELENLRTLPLKEKIEMKL